jgi:hypothetical protein
MRRSVLGTVAVAVGVGVLMKNALPEIQRYVKIARM